MGSGPSNVAKIRVGIAKYQIISGQNTNIGGQTSKFHSRNI